MASDRSREALLDFLDYAKSKGLMKATTAESRKAAANQVLGILDEAEAQDVSTIDLDHLLDRFQTLYGKRYSPDSLRTYKARVKNSIEDFLRYQENPMDFRPRTTLSRKVKTAKRTIAPTASNAASTATSVISRSSSPSVFGTSTVPIPLRQDLTVLIHGLPFDLSEAEARKISNVVLAMASPASPTV